MPQAARSTFSRPVFDQTITIRTNHAQRLLDRGFLLVVRALYGIDVVLRIIGDDEEMDQVEEIVGALIGALAEELKVEHAPLAQLSEANGISASPRYTNPKRITVHISSPQLAQYTALIEELDRLMTVMDALQLTGVLSSKQRADGAYRWRTGVLRTGREISLTSSAGRGRRRRNGGKPRSCPGLTIRWSRGRRCLRTVPSSRRRRPSEPQSRTWRPERLQVAKRGGRDRPSSLMDRAGCSAI